MSNHVLRALAALAAPGLAIASSCSGYPTRNESSACALITSALSSTSTVINYSNATAEEIDTIAHHWFLSSSQTPACVVEPSSAEDASQVMQIIAAAQSPFAVKSGGHASNPGFSSTTGVHISLAKFDQVILSEDNSTVEIGFGQIWTDVFVKLDGTGYGVTGGRTSGPGVGGFTLGGGYSWKTNQFGMTSDTVKSFNLILPNGTIATASDDVNPDIFFALKGGMNRFGVVLSAEFYTHPQPDVYAGMVTYTGDSIDLVLDAMLEFQTTATDPKAAMEFSYNSFDGGETYVIVALFCYDGPDPGTTFAMYDNITSAYDSRKVQSFRSFVEALRTQEQLNVRGTFNTVATSTHTKGFLDAVKAEIEAVSPHMLNHSGTTVSYDVQAFMKFGDVATESAWPHYNSPVPLNLYFAWNSTSDDEFWHTTMKETAERLRDVARAEGIYDEEFWRYPNYAITGTTSEELYGPENAARLAAIRSEIDPKRIMDLTGGFAV